MKTNEAIRIDEKYIFPTYRRTPILFTHGKGPYLYDADGKRYLDLVGGLAVASLGHGNPRIAKAVAEQAKKLTHTSNLYLTEPMLRLASELVPLAKMDKVFFCNSGAEANEAAMKLARRYSNEKYGDERNGIIALNRAFHGRTIATLTATGSEVYKKGFHPLLPGICHAEFNDIKSVLRCVTKNTCAVMVEPVQGEAGVYPASKEFMEGLDTLRRKRGILLIFDEVQCGLGRSGKWFAWQHYGVIPDIITLAKSLGGGLPLGAMLARGDVANAFAPGAHATTFGANPVACAAACEFLSVMRDDKLVTRADKLGKHIARGLKATARRTGKIKEVRGFGLMLGIEIDADARAAAQFLMQRGILVNAIRENIIRIVPPLTITEAHADAFINGLESFLQSAEGQGTGNV